MLKKSFIIVFTAGCIFGLGFVVHQWMTNQEKQHTLNEQNIRDRVQSLYGGDVKRIVIDGDDYEVEFDNELGTYVAVFNRKSGEMTSLSLMQKKERGKEQKPQETKNVKIGEQKAIEIALEKVKGEVDDVELEIHDGSYVYVVEIEREENDALVYIQAYTGEILHITFD